MNRAWVIKRRPSYRFLARIAAPGVTIYWEPTATQALKFESPEEAMAAVLRVFDDDEIARNKVTVREVWQTVAGWAQADP